MLYLDTSLIVALVTVEPPTVGVRDWLAAQPAGQAVVSDWVLTETASALSIKERIGTLDRTSRAASRQVLDVLLDDVLVLVPVDRKAFRAAKRMCERPDLNLRGPDALHLGVAQTIGADLCTRDLVQAQAGTALGLTTNLIEAAVP